MKFIFLDTETTGLKEDRTIFKDTAAGSREYLQKGDEVIQIGGLITDANLVPLRLFCHHCDTTICSMDTKAQQTHGITMEFLRAYVKDIFLEEVLVTELPELFESDIVTIGYNIQFDTKMIKQTICDSKQTLIFGNPIVNSIVPSEGKHTLDLVPFFIKYFNGKPVRQKLESLAVKKTDDYNRFLVEFSNIPLHTNIPMEYAFPNGVHSHNSMYDSIICYLLTKDIWKRKLL